MLRKQERKLIIWSQKYEETVIIRCFTVFCYWTEGTEYQPYRDNVELVLYL